MENPCVTCGACCAYFKASFHWSEADDAGGTVPVGLTVDVDSFRRAMRGTTHKNPCCIALEGVIGADVRCVIYEQRSTTCREFPYSWQEGERHDKCDRARQAHGLEPLSPSFGAPERPNEIAAPDITGPSGEPTPWPPFLESLSTAGAIPFDKVIADRNEPNSESGSVSVSLSKPK